MKHPIFLPIFLVALGAAATTSAAQNNLPDDVRAMAKKLGDVEMRRAVGAPMART